MRLFEAILEANQRAAAGDTRAELRISEHAQALPVTALTCVDPRLNPLLPGLLGIGPEHFIWLRNAGNIITSTTSSTVRSLALACAIKGAKELAVIGHTDCRVGQVSILQLTEAFKALGVERSKLPANLTEYFGVFASERQNVLKAVDFIRHSPLIGRAMPVHGLLVDIESGRLEWLVNGYQFLDTVAARFASAIKAHDPSLESGFDSPVLAEFKMGEMRVPEAPIGEAPLSAADWLKEVKATEPPPELPPQVVKAEKGTPPPMPVTPRPITRPRPKPPRKWWWK
jgi:carbonic anhydrase